jgi:hypothetical protein
MIKMKYEKFSSILNTGLFANAKVNLLESIAKSPQRYVGLFRSTKPSAKMRQNLSQSQEIKFGDAFEEIIKAYIAEYGYTNLERDIKDKNGNSFNIDQYFSLPGGHIFIEQKVRDDHDSTKKQGQISNFEKKLDILLTLHTKSELTGIFYFIDPSFNKNKNYYSREINRLKDTKHKNLYLFYGQELFAHLQHSETWSEICDYLEIWRENIPDFPDTNFDLDPVSTLSEIKNLDPILYRKIFEDRDLFRSTIENIFPTRATLKLLLIFFAQQAISDRRYSFLEELLQLRLDELG